ncbi:MAG: carboxypeptidase-like regulatory domain-containing protein [Bryobacteraceae bacterium]
MVAALLAAGMAAPAGEQNIRRPTSYALVAGTVFRDNGLSLPGARVVLEPVGGAGGKLRLKRQEATSDARGEFAFHVPPQPAEYLLTASAEGYQTQQHKVQVQGEERIDVFFRLARASKN